MGKSFVVCKRSRVSVVYREARSTNGRSVSNKKKLLYVTTKDQGVHRHQPLRRMCKSLRIDNGAAMLNDLRGKTLCIEALTTTPQSVLDASAVAKP
ncbi:hypothetical protein TNCV_4148421 [Trichonephila clavipes]|nr:hypothetical protein TNCV_4148421 [Trichonephila clavipes]